MATQSPQIAEIPEESAQKKLYIFNYRENYMITRLLEQALKKGYLPEFGSEPEEKLYRSKQRNAKWARRLVNLTAVGGLAAMNLLYLLPRYSNLGLTNSLLTNAIFLGLVYGLPQTYLSDLDLEYIATARVCAEKYKEDLHQMQEKGRLIYRFEPARTVFPPDHNYSRNSYESKVNELWDEAHKFKNTLWGELHGSDARYKTTSGMADWRSFEDNNPRLHRGYGKDSAA